MHCWIYCRLKAEALWLVTYLNSARSFSFSTLNLYLLASLTGDSNFKLFLGQSSLFISQRQARSIVSLPNIRYWCMQYIFSFFFIIYVSHILYFRMFRYIYYCCSTIAIILLLLSKDYPTSRALLSCSGSLNNWFVHTYRIPSCPFSSIYITVRFGRYHYHHFSFFWLNL